MRKNQENHFFIAEDFWPYALTEAFHAPTCERTEARYLAFLCALSENPSVLVPTAIIEVASGITALRLQKSPIAIENPRRKKTQKVTFGLDTNIVLDGFLAGTVFDFEGGTFKPYRPFLNSTLSETLRMLNVESERLKKPYYQKARKDLKKIQDPIKLLVRYLQKRGIHADEAQMKINAERYLSANY